MGATVPSASLSAAAGHAAIVELRSIHERDRTVRSVEPVGHPDLSPDHAADIWATELPVSITGTSGDFAKIGSAQAADVR
jgi:hypothetical protein